MLFTPITESPSTVTVTTSDWPDSTARIVMVAVPALSGVITPSLLTVAMLVSLLINDTVVAAPAGLTAYASLCVVPVSKVKDSSSAAMDSTDSGASRAESALSASSHSVAVVEAETVNRL